MRPARFSQTQATAAPGKDIKGYSKVPEALFGMIYTSEYLTPTRVIKLALLLGPPVYIIRTASAVKIHSGEYLRTQCDSYKQHFEPLVRSQLDGLPYEVTLAQILRPYPPGHHENGWPVLYIYDGDVFVDK